jgi:Ca-activated chloride channel family protein
VRDRLRALVVTVIAIAALAAAGVDHDTVERRGPAASQSSAVEPLDVAVTTELGHTVGGLTADDFEVLVDGAAVPVQKAIAPPAPLTLIVLFDVSASMSNYGDIEGEIERWIVPGLRPEDRVRIGGIASRVTLSPKFTSVRKEIINDGHRALDFKKSEKYGPSPIWDALAAAVQAIQPEPGRRGIILITDGRATGNTVSAADAIARSIVGRVVVEVLSEARPIILRQSGNDYARVRSGVMLEELARLTGGMVLPADPPPFGEIPAPGPILQRLITDLREMYTLEIAQAGPPGRAHRFEVKVKRPGVSVRTRSGYRVPAPVPSG